MKERRNSPRLVTPELSIAIETPSGSGLWVADAFDLSGDGLGIVLPPEFPPGTDLLLTFRLGATLPFLRVPAVVLRQGMGTGAVRFSGWTESERLRLLRYLTQHTSEPTRH